MKDTLNPFERIASAIMRRQAWGPLLILVGAYCLFMLFMGSRTIGTIQFVGLGICALLVVSGIVMMFYQLRADYSSVEVGSLGDRSAPPEHVVTQLSKNYEVLRRQTTQGFILAGVFMALGLLVILSGSAGKLFGFSTSGGDLATIAGVIMEFISGTSLLIYRINFKRLNETSDKLDGTWRILTAYRLTESLPEDRKAEATMKLIDALIAGGAAKRNSQQVAPAAMVQPTAPRPSVPSG